MSVTAGTIQVKLLANTEQNITLSEIVKS